MALIGYAKLGRSLLLNPGRHGTVGGDKEPPILLKRLALRNPEHTFVIIGRNDGVSPAAAGLPANVVNPWEDWAVAWRDWQKSYALHYGIKRIHSPLERHEILAVVDAMKHLTHDTFVALDNIVVWAGQHGTSNAPIPQIGEGWNDVLTRPQDSSVYYSSYLTQGIGAWRDKYDGQVDEVWLHSDARNYLKCRDLKWPLHQPMLGQFVIEDRLDKHERYGDKRSPAECGFRGVWDGDSDHVWQVEQSYMYSRLELCSVEPEQIPSQFDAGWETRGHFGIFINEARAYVALNRKDILQHWVLPLDPVFIHGKWTPKSLHELGVKIDTVPDEDFFPLFQSVRTTFTTPSSGSGWATTKPWEAFAAGVVCFFHPDYDSQGHIIPTHDQLRRGAVQSDTLRQLAQWLRVDSPQQLWRRVDALQHDHETWLWLVRAQRRYYDWAWQQDDICRLIEERTGLR